MKNGGKKNEGRQGWLGISLPQFLKRTKDGSVHTASTVVSPLTAEAVLNYLSGCIAYFQTKDFWKTDGLFRESGSLTKINEAHVFISQNPKTDIFTDKNKDKFSSFLSNPHNLINLFKRLIREFEWDDTFRLEVQNALKELKNIDEPVDFLQLIGQLKEKNETQANILYQLLHFANLVAMQQKDLDIQKLPVDESGFGTVIYPNISTLFKSSDISSERLKSGIAQGLQSNAFLEPFSSLNTQKRYPRTP